MTDEKWEAMTEGEKIAATWKLLWPKMRPEFYPSILDWRAFGKIVESMHELGWWGNVTFGAAFNTITWSKSVGDSVVRGEATLGCPIQANALAAIRAIQETKP